MNVLKLVQKSVSKAQNREIAAFVARDNTSLTVLVDAFLSGPYRITQRAAGILNEVAERHPQLIQSHLKRLLLNLSKPKIDDAVKRNTLRMLQFIDVPRPFHGRLTSICFDFLQRPDEAIAIKVFAMTALANLCAYHPELKNELIVIIDDLIVYGSAGIRARGRKIKNLLNSIHNPLPT